MSSIILGLVELGALLVLTFAAYAILQVLFVIREERERKELWELVDKGKRPEPPKNDPYL
jgi:hypothetical protein